MNQMTSALARLRVSVLCVVVATGLSACGGGTRNQVASVCMEAIGAELGGQPFEGDPAQFAAASRDEGEGIVVIESTVIVDKGLTSEVKRGFMCRVQTDPQGKAAPSVILLQLGF